LVELDREVSFDAAEPTFVGRDEKRAAIIRAQDRRLSATLQQAARNLVVRQFEI